MTDNDNLRAKLALRRHFLQRYHADGKARVFDACQGSGVLWKRLRSEFKVDTYWGVDVKRTSGRIAGDSVKVLEAGLRDDVIDVDTYGSPWAHWVAVLKWKPRPLTVFLTIGEKSAASNRPLSIAEAELMGLGKLYGQLPHKLKLRMARVLLPHMLAQAQLHGFDIVEAGEGVRGLSARYIGVRLAPASSGTSGGRARPTASQVATNSGK